MLLDIIEIIIFCVAVYFVLEYKDKYQKDIKREIKRIKKIEELDELINTRSKKG